MVQCEKPTLPLALEGSNTTNLCTREKAEQHLTDMGGMPRGCQPGPAGVRGER